MYSISSDINRVPEWQIRDAHMADIKNAIEDAQEFDIRDRQALAEALNYWRAHSPAGVRRFEQGLRQGSLPMLIEARHMIERFL